MSLVFSSSFVRLCSSSIKYYSLYSYFTMLDILDMSNSDFSLDLLCCAMVSLPERCDDCGLVSATVVALYLSRRCRVVFSNVGAVLILIDIAKWIFTPRSSGAWAPMVTARDVCAPTFAFRDKDPFLVMVIPCTGSGCIAMTGCRKKLGSPGWFLDNQGSTVRGYFPCMCDLVI